MKQLLSISLLFACLSSGYAQQDSVHYYHSQTKKWGFTATFLMDVIDANFGQFDEAIGDYNTKVLDGFVGVFALEIAATQKRKYFGAAFGLLFSDRLGDIDSLNIDLNKNLFNVNFGYKIIDNRKVSLMPSLDLKWYRYRLLNTAKDNKIPLSQYLNNRELDLRFNQATAALGLRLSFKFPYRLKSKGNNISPHGYWTLGAYGAYLQKLHNRPLLYSRRTQLTSNYQIDLKKYNFGIFFSMNVN